MANKKKRCKECDTFVIAETGVQFPVGFFCSFQHATDFTNRPKQKKKVQKIKKQETAKDLRDLNRRTLGWQHKKTQAVFNKMRVLEELLWFQERGTEPVCISCSKPLGGDQWCCGHFKTVGHDSGLRYDPLNTFLQHNRSCNMKLSGNIEGTKTTHGYKKGLIIRFGEVEGQKILDYCERSTDPVKWFWEDLEEARAQYSARYRTLLRDNGIKPHC